MFHLPSISLAALLACGCTRGGAPDSGPPPPPCIDSDGDGRGQMCELGSDCDDRNPVQTGTEICDGLDNDCDTIADEDALSACGNCDAYCTVDAIGVDAPGGSFDTEADPSRDVAVGDDGALVLVSHHVDTHFIWIANTGEGTVSKIDTRTFIEVGRYATGPSGAANDPSRTSVSTLGDVYVGNRAGGSVTKISALGTSCPDTNGDGTITTSTGPDDVLAWGMDDCVVWSTPMPGSIVRAVAAQDVVGLDYTLIPYVWIGLWNEREVLELDGETGEVLLRTPSPTGTYGFALDGRGQLWISGRGDHAIGRIDTTRCLGSASCGAPCTGDPAACVKEAIPLPGGHDPYGITVDARQRVWTANLGDQTVTRYDPAAPAGARWAIASVAGECHGIAADAMGWVWAACWTAGVLRLLGDNPTTNTFVTGSAGQSVKGMAVDFDGKVWAINQNHDSAIVITPGPTLLDATVTTGVANRIVSPYTYSDMTGQQLRLATRPSGEYRHVFEGCAADARTTGTEWIDLRFDADAPPETWIVWRVRTAPTRAELGAATWVHVAEVPPSSSPLSIRDALAEAGIAHERFLEVEVQLHSERSSLHESITPRVFSFGPTHTCPPTIG